MLDEKSELGLIGVCCVADEALSWVYVYYCNVSRMAENLTKIPRRGILKQSTSFEQRGDDK